MLMILSANFFFPFGSRRPNTSLKSEVDGINDETQFQAIVIAKCKKMIDTFCNFGNLL